MALLNNNKYNLQKKSVYHYVITEQNILHCFDFKLGVNLYYIDEHAILLLSALIP